MAVFSNTPAPQTQTSNGKADKPAAKIWLNFGYKTTDPETGEELFIGLPMGIPVDTQEKRSAGSSKLMQAKNAFLDKIIADSANMAPGEERYLQVQGGYWVQLRHVAEREAATSGNNAYIAALGSLGGFGATAPAAAAA
jgi:hypothetical protein